MEKLDKPQSKDYGPLVIWAGDLVELFSELRDCTNIEFVADDVKFESVDEFVKESKGRNPSNVKITAPNPYLTVELYHHWARLYVSSSQLLPSGLFLKIDSILSRCERKPRFFYRYAWAWACYFVLPWVFFLPPLRPFDYLGFWFLGLIFSWMTYISFVRLRRFSIVQPIHREERPGFVRRNIDGIVKVVISALLGAVIGAAATKVADRVWPNCPNTAVERDAPQAAQPLAPRPSP